MPSRDFVNNPDEGYRALVPSKITQNQDLQPKMKLKKAKKKINERGGKNPPIRQIEKIEASTIVVE